MSLVNHVVAKDRWTPPLLAGRTIADVGDRLDGDLLGADPDGAARAAAGEATAGVAERLPGRRCGPPLLRRRGHG